jgi:hypothetical protein
MLFNIIVLSLVTIGIAQLFDEGMILGTLGAYIGTLSPATRWMLKPVILCPPCMASVWGTIAALYLGHSFVDACVLILATAGLNYIIVNR